MTPKTQIKAVGYARCSHAHQVEKDASIPAQKESCARTARSNGHQLFRWFEDAGISGRSLKGRDGLADCIKYLESHREVRALYVCSASRLARSQEDALHLRKKLKRIGVEVICAGQSGERDDITAILVDGIFDILSEVESRMMGRRGRRGQHHALREGFWPWSQVPYGYRRNMVEITEKNVRYRLEYDPETADTVRRIYRMSLEGDGDKAVAARLTKQQISPPSRKDIKARRPGLWRPKHVANILKNPIYTGTAVLTTRDRDSRKIIEQEEIEDRFPAIVSREIFDAVQVARRARYRNPRSDPGGNRSGHGLFRPVLRCGVCGGPITLTGGCDRRRNRIWYYACRNRSGNRESCTGLTTRMMDLDALLREYVEGQLLTEQALRDLIAQTVQQLKNSGATDLNAARNKVQRKLEKAQAALANLARAVAAGLLDDTEVAVQAAEARQDKADAERELAAMPASVEIPKLEDIDVASYRMAILDRWHSKDLATRRKAIKKLIDTIELRPDGTAVVRYRPPEASGEPYPHHAPFGPPYAPMSLRLPSGSIRSALPASTRGESLARWKSHWAGSSP